MKVELENIVVGIGGITGKAFAGTLNKSKTMWLKKIDVDDSFVASVIQRWLGKKETITYEGGDSYEISVKKIKTPELLNPSK